MWTIAISLALLGLATVVSAYLARNTRASTPFDTTRLVSTWNPPAKKRALVLYTPGFTTVTRHIAMAAGRALSSVGYDVTTAAARPGDTGTGLSRLGPIHKQLSHNCHRSRGFAERDSQ